MTSPITNSGKVKPTFKEWLKQLDAVANEYGHKESSYSEMTGDEAWQGYYDNDYSPEEAYREDCSYG